ncbi:4-oxalomesaconate tautomerase [Xenorhabdus mauleonii]|uniref:4-oxalomesaconate tautomerase n=1 Tax=Xenorhabdus mauleonii TaxID=351675 RepID=A0A1I3KRJ1_9GAMM|nr:PrpF domain-containing protein [Xenorhabdus mauleonii]PHM45130.1 4-oxalomesaconate tautomerase [Xenorhabdus mauleonii]SFI74980.1 hypothetical protein SAMN05421680_103167 [Xenorhabdus mauleonii]
MKRLSFTIPLYYVRGGTSTGIVLLKKHLPEKQSLKEEILRHIMGVPLEGRNGNNKQTHGLGRESTTSNKVLIIDVDYEAKRIISHFAQLENESNKISWDINCGNMTSSIPLVVSDFPERKLLMPDGKLKIYNINTKKNILCTMSDIYPEYQLVHIPGVMGVFPEVQISLEEPACSKTSALFPTGNLVDKVNGIQVTCIDVAVPMIIINAVDLGLSGYESADQIKDNKALQEKMMEIRVRMGIAMGIGKKSGGVMNKRELRESITQPKIAIIAPPRQGGNINVRYFTPKTIHASIAVSGGCCLAAACCFMGTVASHLYYASAVNGNSVVRIEHLSGISEFSVTHNGEHIAYASVQRTAQILMKGEFFIYNPSDELINGMKEHGFK